MQKLDLDITASAEEHIMSFPKYDFYQYFQKSVTGSLNVMLLTALLHPIDRVQIVKQIQESFSNSTLKNDKLISVLARCTNYGIRSMFRGLKMSMLRNAILFSTFEFWDTFSYEQNPMAQNIIKGLFVFSGYLLAYPLQAVKLRMGADIQKQRFYSNVRQCIQKVKKHEGATKLFQGFGIGLIHFSSQLFLIDSLIKLRNNYEGSLTNPVLFSSLFAASLIGYETILYPLDTIKKLVQINGALGHQNKTAKVRKVISTLKPIDYFRGLPVRMLNSAFYTVASIMIGSQNTNKN